MPVPWEGTADLVSAFVEKHRTKWKGNSTGSPEGLKERVYTKGSSVNHVLGASLSFHLIPIV